MVKPAEDFPVGTKTLSFKEPPAGHAEWQKELSNNAAYSPLAMTKGSGAASGAAAATGPITSVKGADGVRRITMAEVEQHASDNDAWIVVKDKVYDCTPFLEDHPGGSASITMNAGTDTTEDFTAVHSAKAWKDLEKYYIGELVSDAAAGAAAAAPASAAAPAAVAAPGEVLKTLDPKKKVKVTLASIEKLSRDVRRLRFALPTPQHILGLPIGNHFFVNATVKGEPCMRAYTPTSLDDDVGFLEMVIKVYFANENERFPEGGKMSQHFESLKVGDTIDIKGPIGHFTYIGRGRYKLHNELRQCDSMGMICGGTGITPAFQVIKAALKDDNDRTKFHVLYANQTPADVLLKPELDAWAEKYPERVKVWYTVDKVPEGVEWKYSTGFINEEMIKEHMPKPGLNGEAFVGMCGPPPMIKFACIPNLEKVGYTSFDYMSF
jgi:nitrate reductase (NAD(P)H)